MLRGHREGDLVGRGEEDARDDGDEREVDGEREDLAEEDRRERAREERLERLHHVGEGHSAVGRRDGAQRVAERQAGANGQELPHPGHVHARSRADRRAIGPGHRQPQPADPQRPDEELQRGKRERELPHHQHLLVEHAVLDVEEEPAGKGERHEQRVNQAGWHRCRAACLRHRASAANAQGGDQPRLGYSQPRVRAALRVAWQPTLLQLPGVHRRRAEREKRDRAHRMHAATRELNEHETRRNS
eukprot:scaffold123943_cov75-Phaeocystis_antarctica.AAC.3